MKVAFIVDKFPEPSETFVLDQFTGLLERGLEVDVFARFQANGQHGLRARVRYFGPPLSRAQRLAGALRIASRQLARRPRQLVGALNPWKGGKDALSLRTLYMLHCFATEDSAAYDVIHCHFGPNGAAGIVLRDLLKLRAKLVTSFYGYDVSQHRWRQPEGPYRRLFAEGDLFIAISDSMRARLVAMGCPGARIEHLPLGIDLRRLEFRPRTRPQARQTVIATAARFIEKKGLEYSVRAVAELRERFPDVLYKIAGDGPQRAALESLIQQLDLAANVRLVGWLNRDEIRDLLNEADLFVLPSVTAEDGDEEGTPTALLEALAVGLPVVSTLHAGIPEIVEDGRTGYLVPERDVGALADRLAYLLENPGLWAELGRAGRESVERRHDGRMLAGRLCDIYRRLLEESRAG